MTVWYIKDCVLPLCQTPRGDRRRVHKTIRSGLFLLTWMNFSSKTFARLLPHYKLILFQACRIPAN